MIIHQVEQRSQEWFKLRWGRITGSQVARLYAGERGQKKYYAELAAQRELPAPEQFEPQTSQAMQWGIDNEPRAVANVELDLCVDLILSPVVEDDDGLILASLDAAFADTWVPVEIKCPFNTGVHLGYIANGMGDHRWQLIAGMAVTGNNEGLFVSFDPRESFKPLFKQTTTESPAVIQDMFERAAHMEECLRRGSFTPAGLPTSGSIPSLF